MRKLIMVYNADSGYFNAVADGLHKMFSPATYSCNLCAVTYGAVSMKDDWRRFVEALDVPVTFLHRDEYLAGNGDPTISLPAIFLQDGDADPSVLIEADAINSVTTIDELKSLIETGLDRVSDE